ncbi:MAG: hypothetical protein AAF153_01580, partial [Pseudomonadota bacterium]
DEKIPELTFAPFTNAYGVTSQFATNKKYAAIVLNRGLPTRLKEIIALDKLSLPGVVMPESIEIVELTNTNTHELVMLSKVPKTITLAQYIEDYGAMNEDFIFTKILPQLFKSIKGLHANEIVHGSINPDNIYYDLENDTFSYNNNFGYPCGYFQKTIYEPFERMVAHPIGKEDPSISTDYYALGITILYCALGGKLLSDGLTDEEIIENRYLKSTEKFLLPFSSIPPRIKNLVKGLLCDKKSERWGAPKIAEWLRGSKMNHPIVSLYGSSSRPFKIKDISYPHTGYLSHHLFRDWGNAYNVLQEPMLLRWIEKILEDEVMAEKVNFQLRTYHYARGSVTMSENEFTTKCLMILDPIMPIRIKEFAVQVGSIPNFLVFAYHENNNSAKDALITIINSTIYSFAVDHLDESRRLEMTPHIQMMDKCRRLHNREGLGFGLERCLYDLNPNLACQTPGLIDKYVTNALELLDALDAMSKEGKEIDLNSLHTCAFLASKVGMQQHLFHDPIEKFSQFYEHPNVKALIFFASAQDILHYEHVSNFVGYLAERTKEVINIFRCRSIKDDQFVKIARARNEDNIYSLMRIATDVNNILADNTGFQVAARRYYQL